jgi:type II secretory ATPase GspE/PulE/Tfp pilus assembly ATPase PilB-like protein
MRLEPYLISSSLNVLISQRLVRKVCPQCRKLVSIPEQIQKKLGLDSQWKGDGCSACSYSGYSGRIGLFEVVVLSLATKMMIVNYSISDSTSSFMSSLRANSTGSMQKRGIEMIQKGITTWEEIHRCIGLLD